MRNLCPLLVGCALFIPVLAGCSAEKEHGHVTGVVKINGEPVEHAAVTFMPEGGGRSAFAETGPDGSYELKYTPGVNGAKLGTNLVTISTYVEPTLDDNDKVVDPGKPERFPPEYNLNSSQKVEVEPGENVFDFDVETSQESYPQPQE